MKIIWPCWNFESWTRPNKNYKKQSTKLNYWNGFKIYETKYKQTPSILILNCQNLWNIQIGLIKPNLLKWLKYFSKTSQLLIVGIKTLWLRKKLWINPRLCNVNASIHDWGARKECLFFFKNSKDNFDFFLYLHHYNFNTLLYANI